MDERPLALCVRAHVPYLSFKVKLLMLGIGSELSLQLFFIVGLSSKLQLRDPGLGPTSYHSNIMHPILRDCVFASS